MVVNPQLVEKVRELRSRWESQEPTRDQKNQVGIAFVAYILDLGYEVAESFAKSELKAYNRVDDKLSPREEYTPDLDRFWGEVNEIFPNLHTEEDLQFLLSKDSQESAAWSFLWSIEELGGEESPVIRCLNLLVHANK